MEYKLVKLDRLSGKSASLYSLFVQKEQKTLFDKFIEENKNSFKSELKDIVKRLNTIGNKIGAREHFFKQNEGDLGDGVCAFYDIPNSKLRLYCIRYGSLIVILGNGGYKPKNIRAFQEDEKLTEENFLMRKISAIITERIENQEIVYSEDYMDFEGNLEFNI